MKRRKRLRTLVLYGPKDVIRVHLLWGKGSRWGRGAAPVFDGGRRDFSRDSSALATMDGESGDSSSELHITSVPNTDDSESHRKPADIMCVPPDVTTPTQPTDFSLKFNNNLSRFSSYETRTLEETARSDMTQRDPEKNPECEFEFQNRETGHRVTDYLSNKDNFREFRNNFHVGAPDSAIGLSKEQRMRATEFAVALNYNKDPHRTSDFAGMILQHHQRFVIIFLILILYKSNL